VNLINGKIIYKSSHLGKKNLKFKGKIAIIVNNVSGSQAEIIAASFQRRKNVKIFGEETSGSLSSRTRIRINKEIYIFIAHDLIRNATTKKVYVEEKIIPDIPIKEAQKFFRE
jgi:C-terminal processing protease CtpA/Prc